MFANWLFCTRGLSFPLWPNLPEVTESGKSGGAVGATGRNLLIPVAIGCCGIGGTPVIIGCCCMGIPVLIGCCMGIPVIIGCCICIPVIIGVWKFIPVAIGCWNFAGIGVVDCRVATATSSSSLILVGSDDGTCLPVNLSEVKYIATANSGKVSSGEFVTLDRSLHKVRKYSYSVGLYKISICIVCNLYSYHICAKVLLSIWLLMRIFRAASAKYGNSKYRHSRN